MDKNGYVYIVTNKRNGTLYTGVTTTIAQRIQQHREGLIDGFTTQNDCKYLVWYEAHTEIANPIYREKLIKRWHRDWKCNLIECANPEWQDLWPTLFGGDAGPPLAR